MRGERRDLTLTLTRAILAIVPFAVVFTLAAAALVRLVEPRRFHSFGSACWWAVQTAKVCSEESASIF